MEELCERGGEESCECDKGRTIATPASRWCHPEHPASVDAAGKLIAGQTDSNLCPRRLYAARTLVDERRTSGVSSEFCSSAASAFQDAFRKRGRFTIGSYVLGVRETHVMSAACIRSRVCIRYTAASTRTCSRAYSIAAVHRSRMSARTDPDVWLCNR